MYVPLQLGLGSGCVRVVPCNSVVGSPLAMDVAALDRMMVEDSAAQKKPLLVIANAGVFSVCRSVLGWYYFFSMYFLVCLSIHFLHMFLH